MPAKHALVASASIFVGIGLFFLAESMLVGTLFVFAGVYVLILPHLIDPQQQPAR